MWVGMVMKKVCDECGGEGVFLKDTRVMVCRKCGGRGYVGEESSE